MSDETKPTEETQNTPAEQPEEAVSTNGVSEEPAAEEAEVVVPEATLKPGHFEEIEPGMTVKVFQRIKDITSKGVERERTQFFEGVVLARKHGKQDGATITVRKVSNGVGVEKIFPLGLPTITKIDVLKKLKSRRRSKLYFLRTYKKRLKEVKA